MSQNIFQLNRHIYIEVVEYVTSKLSVLIFLSTIAVATNTKKLKVKVCFKSR